MDRETDKEIDLTDEAVPTEQTEPIPQTEPMTEPTAEEQEFQQTEPSAEEIGSFVREELRRLMRAYPDCGAGSLKELMQKPYAKELMRYWSRGVPLYKAYGLVNADEIYSQREKAQRQSALNTLRSKGHLRAVGGSPSGQRAVPAEVMEQYREFFPDWSEAQIIRDYQSRA